MTALWTFLLAILGMCTWISAGAKAEPAIEYLQLPSAAMGRDIPVAFMASDLAATIK